MKTRSSLGMFLAVGLSCTIAFVQLTHAQENYSYLPPQLQSGATSAGERFFQSAMSDYRHGNTESAFTHFKLAVRHSPTQSNYWLYMGVAYLLEDQADQAISALEKADHLSIPSARSRAKWYLAQSYLAANNAEKAIPLLQWVATAQREYSANADTLLIELSAIARK